MIILLVSGNLLIVQSLVNFPCADVYGENMWWKIHLAGITFCSKEKKRFWPTKYCLKRNIPLRQRNHYIDSFCFWLSHMTYRDILAFFSVSWYWPIKHLIDLVLIKNCKFSISFFVLFFFTFLNYFHNDLIPLSNIFRSQKKLLNSL